MNNLIEFTTQLPTKNIFGLGESNNDFVLKDGFYTIWNKDFPFELAKNRKGYNTYGHRPI